MSNVKGNSVPKINVFVIIYCVFVFIPNISRWAPGWDHTAAVRGWFWRHIGRCMYKGVGGNVVNWCRLQLNRAKY